jgi:hypothetical protein
VGAAKENTSVGGKQLGIFGKLGELIGNLSSSTRVEDPTPEKTLAQGQYLQYQETVGESFRSDNFLRLMKRHFIEPDSRNQFVAMLELDPNNPNSKSGKAVRVYVEGIHLSFIPELDSFEFFDKIQERGEIAFCGCEIWFDDPKSEKPRHSLSLLVQKPLRFSDEPNPEDGYRNSTYNSRSPKTQKMLDEKREVVRTTKPDTFPPLNHGDEIYFSSTAAPLDSNFFIETLAKKGISDNRISKARTVLAVVGTRDYVEASAELEKAVLWDKPIITFDEFQANYPDLLPTKERMAARELALNGILRNWQEEDFHYVKERILDKASSTAQLLRGVSYLENPFVSVGVHKGVNTQKYKEDIQKLFEQIQGSTYDSLVIRGSLGIDSLDGRAFISVSGLRVGDGGLEDQDSIKWQIENWKGDEIVIQINWIHKSRFSLSFGMDYAKWPEAPYSTII